MKTHITINGFRHLMLAMAAMAALPGWAAMAEKTAFGYADFDGDGLTDPAEYSASNGWWRICLSNNRYQTVSFVFGGENCRALADDYDSDGKADPVLYDTSSGVWTVKLSASGYATASVSFAATAAIPIAADFDGDGQADPAIYQDVLGLWTTRLSTCGYAPVSLAFGGNGAQPMAGDYDGDGRSDPAVYQTASGTWSAKLSSVGYVAASLEGFGGTAYTPVISDFDGDRRVDPAIYQEAEGIWSVRLSQYDYARVSLTGFGGQGDTPVAGDYDGDGRTDPAFYRESEAMVSVYFSGTGVLPVAFQQTNVLHVAAELGAAVRAGDQAIALLYTKYTPEYDMTCLWWQVVSRDGTVLNDELMCRENIAMPGWAAADLVMDAGLEPHIFTGYYGGVEHLSRSQGVWQVETVASPGEVGSAVMARMDASGYFHLCSAAVGAAENETVTVSYYSNRGGTWQAEIMPFSVGPSRWLVARDFAVDSAGNAHVILSLQYHPSDDVTWPGTLYYLSNTGGAWFNEVAAYKTHSSWDSYFPNASLAVDSQGRPAVAVRLKYNVLTGSDALSQLVYYRRTGSNAWTEEILADTADNYFGTDGGHFTGILPVLAFDNSGDAHIMFSDLASSHISGYESATWGQIRYARCISGAWSLATLFRQSPAAGDGIMSKYFILSADGKTLDVVARIYPNNDCIVHFSSSCQTCFYFE